MATMKQTRSTDRNEPLLALGVGKRDANGAIPVVVVQESLESYLPPSSVDRQECTIFASNLDKHETVCYPTLALASHCFRQIMMVYTWYTYSSLPKHR